MILLKRSVCGCIRVICSDNVCVDALNVCYNENTYMNNFFVRSNEEHYFLFRSKTQAI